jgi:hypothetical protein
VGENETGDETIRLGIPMNPIFVPPNNDNGKYYLFAIYAGLAKTRVFFQPSPVGFIGFYWVLLSFIGFYWVIGFFGFF